MSLPFNKIISDPGLQNILDDFKRNIFLSLNSHAVAKVQSFNVGSATEAPRISATINYQQTYLKRQESGTYIQIQVPYPTLIDCPVVILGGGPAYLTFPIAKGDDCLVLFNDRDLNNWFSGANSGPCQSNRLHSFSDGIILVGLRSNANPILNYDTVRALISDGTVKLGINPDLEKVLISNGTTLNTLLQNLITHIEALVTATAAITVTGVTTGVGVSGVPVNAATITAINTNLIADATAIGGLLE